MKKYLPTDVSTFSTMMTGNYVYVDKTEHIYNLFSGGTRLYFLSRPRRFGKSLLISTLKELFLGNREFFEGLWIDSSDYQWIKYPVIHLDFAQIGHKSADDLEKNILVQLLSIAKDYHITMENSPSINAQLSFLITELFQKNKVVILIDEYDKPILDHIDNVEKAHEIKKVIASFYDTIKSLDKYIRAIFVTGVTKFAKTSIFSGMNNLNDISFDEISAELLGYTEQELTIYFDEYINALAHKNSVSYDTLRQQIKTWYNGYRFSTSDTKVYNPFSVLYYLSKQRLANYWFKSGTPTFLIHLIKKQYVDLEAIPTNYIKPDHLETFELDNIPLIPLLFQAGYLTVADYDHIKNKITLDYPNHEIKESFIECIVASLSNTTVDIVSSVTSRLLNCLDSYDLEGFCNILTSLFARIPYTLHINKESYYHSLFHFLMNLLNIETQSEVLTNKGRIDTVMTTEKYVYIFELKINKKPQEAVQQIMDKKYYEAYQIYNKQIILVGLSFIIDQHNFTIEHVAKKLD